MKRALILLVVLFSMFSVFTTALHTNASPLVQCQQTKWKTISSTPFVPIDNFLKVSVSEEKLVDSNTGAWCGDIRGKGTFNRTDCSSYSLWAELHDKNNDTLGYNSATWNAGCGGQYALFGFAVDGFNYPCPFYAQAGDSNGNWDTSATCS